MTSKSRKKDKELRFDEGLRQLEELALQLEQGNLPLEECVALFERGMALSRQLEEVLKEAERRIEILVKKADGSLETAPFSTPTDQEMDE